jgi:hypothetical protein
MTTSRRCSGGVAAVWKWRCRSALLIECSSRSSGETALTRHHPELERPEACAACPGVQLGGGAGIARVRGRLVGALVAAIVGVLLTPAAARAADPALALAQRYAPVVRLVAQTEPCKHGEAYVPTNVDLVLGNPEVAFRGPWDKTNIIKVAPSAQDLAHGLFDYHLDFPGSAVAPGCTYDEWSHRIDDGHAPTTYARLVADPAYPNKLALSSKRGSGPGSTSETPTSRRQISAERSRPGRTGTTSRQSIDRPAWERPHRPLPRLITTRWLAGGGGTRGSSCGCRRSASSTRSPSGSASSRRTTSCSWDTPSVAASCRRASRRGRRP